MPREDGRGGDSVAQRFAHVVAAAARSAGYDIDSPRGGGKAELARHTGMKPSSVGRMLAGQTLPDPRFFEPIAMAVHLPVRTLLIEAEIISAESLTESPPTRVASRLTPEEAADGLGIAAPEDRELFLGVVARLRREGPTPSDPDDRHEPKGQTAQG